MKLIKIITAACVLATGSTAFGAAAYFSTLGFGAGASLSNPSVNTTTVGGPVDLHIYFVPDPMDATYVGVSLGVSSSTAGVADITSFSFPFPSPPTLNPNLVDIVVTAAPSTVVNTRWDGVGGNLVNTELLDAMTGVAVTTAGLNVLNDGSGGLLDAGYDATASAFYFGSVTLTPVGVGATDLSLLVGTGGVARAGDNPQPAGPTVSLFFGDAEPTSVLGDDFGATGTVVDATITVVPEPSTVVLLGAGALLGLLRRRRS